MRPSTPRPSRSSGSLSARPAFTAGAPARERARRRRAGLRRPPRRRHRLRILLIALSVLASLAGGLVAAVFVAYASYRAQLPDARTVAAMEPALDSHVYDAAGNLIAVFNDPGARHVHASLDNISRWSRLATIDVEDRHFYSEGSWDLPRLVKAGWDNIHHTGLVQGASTITEQLAKISFFNSPQRSLDYKIKEIVLGNELDAAFTKDQILEMYLNRVPYGNHAIGIETAAELYFFTPAANLDLAQASLLAGLPQSPSQLNPLIHDSSTTVNPYAKERQQVVLSAMVSNGDITRQQADLAYGETLTFHSWTESTPDTYPSVADYVTRWLNTRYGNTYINPGGWDIHTTIDPAKQVAAQTALHNGILAIRKAHNARDGAVVNIDPRTGAVLAIVGAWDNSDPEVGQTDMAMNRRSPGSTIKLFTYSAALASHLFTMTTPILDAPVTLSPGPGQTYAPLNYDRRWHGTCLVKSCLGNSLNVPAVKVEAAVGIPYITNLEIAAGISSYADGQAGGDRPCPTCYSATLGGYPVTPLELADGAATIADLGIHHDPSPVLSIVDRTSGRTFFTLNPATSARRVVPENVAFIINEITSNDANRVMDFGAHGDLWLPDRRVSAKTGTAEFFLDNWTVGWTPELVSAVWVGNPYNSCLQNSDRATMARNIARGNVLYRGMTVDDPFSPSDLAHYHLKPRNSSCGHLDNSSGITGAAPIWHKDIVAALAGVKPDWYSIPNDVTEVGTGDNGDFYLPGTSPATSSGGNSCTFWGPDPLHPPSGLAPDCQYIGTSPPASRNTGAAPTRGPAPSPSPTGGRVVPTPPTGPPPRPTGH